ncbi:MAG: cytidylate kinase-like family protein [Eubacterium sp.]|nr:cytidylate kinase-like family protein [Eubacterium sp.]
MDKQILISISREYGSRGREIAIKVAEDMGLPLYDRNILEEIAKEKGTDPKNFQDIDEKPRNKLLTRRVKGYSNSMEENLAQMQFEYLQKKADSGESFVVLGRCSETVLKGREGLVSIFVTGEREAKIQHIMDKFSISREEAIAKIYKHDISRKRYHNHYSDFKWGDSRNYDVCINSSRLGPQGTAEVLEAYIQKGL